MATIKELELSLIVKEAMIQQLKYKNELLTEEIASVYEDVIDKAVDYIEQHNDYFLLKREVKELLNILKGGNKE